MKATKILNHDCMLSLVFSTFFSNTHFFFLLLLFFITFSLSYCLIFGFSFSCCFSACCQFRPGVLSVLPEIMMEKYFFLVFLFFFVVIFNVVDTVFHQPFVVCQLPDEVSKKKPHKRLNSDRRSKLL